MSHSDHCRDDVSSSDWGYIRSMRGRSKYERSFSHGSMNDARFNEGPIGSQFSFQSGGMFPGQNRVLLIYNSDVKSTSECGQSSPEH
jgi:hypothetical protein